MEEIRLLDPELATFTNINKIEDLTRMNLPASDTE